MIVRTAIIAFWKKVFVLLILITGMCFDCYAQSSDSHEKKYTVNTDPVVMALGVYYLTLDIVVADHFIWGNAVVYRNGKMCAVPVLRDELRGVGYTSGLAYFPFNPESRGFHVASFTTVMKMFGEEKSYISPTTGSYAGYSFHFYDTIKLSLKLGGMYTFKENLQSFPDGYVFPHMSFEVGYMF